jgi:hypothetical protein
MPMIERIDLAGKVVRSITLFEDGRYGPEITIDFEDGSSFKECLGVKMTFEAKWTHDEGGQPQVYRTLPSLLRNWAALTAPTLGSRADSSGRGSASIETTQPTAISSHTGTEYAYSLGVSAGIVGLSYLAHRRGYHRIERLLPTIDIVYDGHAALHNYTLLPQVTSPVRHLPNRTAK